MFSHLARNNSSYVTPRKFNAQSAFREPYDWLLEDGGTAPPSRCTLDKAYRSDPDRRRIRKSFVPASTLDQIFCCDNSSYYSYLTEAVLEHFGVYQTGTEFIIDDKTMQNITRMAGGKVRPIPSELEEEILEEGLLFVDFMGSINVPDPIVTAVEKYIKDPLAYRRVQRQKIEERQARRQRRFSQL